MIKYLFGSAAIALALAAAPAASQDVAITNATLVIGNGGEPIANGTVVVQAGKVVSAGTDATVPDGVAVVDAQGAFVTPGIFATLTTLGIWDVSAVQASNDTRANDAPFSAALDVVSAINPNSQHILVHRAAGITRAATTTTRSGSIFAGQGAIIDLDSDTTPVMVPRAFQMVDLGETGAQIAGGSRAATYALFRFALREAQGLAAGEPTGPAISTGDDIMLSRFDAEALIPVVEGKQKLYVAVERAADIRNALGLREEFPKLDMVLIGASEGWLVADEIAASGVPVLADGLNALPTGFDQLASTQSNIGRLVKAGVTVGVNATAMEDPRRLSQYAGNLVALTKVPGADGLSWGQAFAAISSVPAQISGLGGQAGVLAEGAAGDLVIWDNDPLEVGSVPTRVYIGGVAQDLTSHQSRLKDRYRDLDESELPKAYVW